MFIKPDMRLDDVTQINCAQLQDRGITGLIFDLDNTLMLPKKCHLLPRIGHWLEEVQQNGMRCIVLTNNPHLDYCQQAEALLKMPVICHAKKPDCEKFIEALQQLQLKPSEVAMIGDRLLTDVWVGQKMDAFTIWVKPLIGKEERPVYRFLRLLEQLTLSP